MLSYLHINVRLFDRPASIAQSHARLNGDQEVAGSILPGWQQSFFSTLSQEGQLSDHHIHRYYLKTDKQ